MIVTVLKNRIVPPPFVPITYPGWKSPTYNTPDTDTWKEAKRRDDIIKRIYKECKYYPGQKLTPKEPDAAKEYGVCTIIGVCSSYALYGKDVVWPTSDNPLIVTVLTSKQATLFTTDNYF